MNIVVVGTGYVGLVSGTCFAETGNTVYCVDIDPKKIDKLQNGEVTIYEPGLEVVFKRNLKANRLHFTTDLASVLNKAEIVFLALPTPPGEDGSADLKYVLMVADQIGKIMDSYKVIVNKSTVPVGTADRVKAAIQKNATCDFDVVSNPEFLREGVAVTDFLKPDRVVVGTNSERARKLMAKLYEPYVKQGNPVIFMDERSSEMTKYAANSYLATRITFMNEIANLCEKVGANVDLVRKGMGSDHRIGKHFLYSGIGFGGSCFPKDVQALHKTANENSYDFQILNSVLKVNNNQKHVLSQRILDFNGNNLNGITIGIWGLAFKPNTDDIREAPSLYIIQDLLDAGAKVKVFDPEAMENVKEIFGDKIQYATNQYEALEGADMMAILTEWSQFRSPDFDLVFKNLKRKIIFDGRNLYDLNDMKSHNCYYNSIGRPLILPN